jgi:hypothetical protein
MPSATVRAQCEKRPIEIGLQKATCLTARLINWVWYWIAVNVVPVALAT